MPGWRDRAEPVKPSWRDRAEPVEKDGPSDLGTAIEQAGQAVSLGYLPQITAAIESPLDEESRAYLNAPIGELFNPEFREQAAKGRGVDKTYQQIRDEKIAQFEEGSKANPVASAVGSGAGMVGSALSIPAKMFGATNTLGQAVKAGARAGAAYGALSNPGDVAGEVSPLQLGERGFNAVTGAALGGVGGAAGDILGKTIQKAPQMISDKASDMAARALGRGTQDLKQRIGDKGVRAMGRKALDEGVIGAIPKSAQGIDDAVNSLRQGVGKNIGKIIDKVDEAERSLANTQATGVDKQSIVDKVKAELIDEDLFQDPAYVLKIEDRLAKFMTRGGDSPSIGTKGAQDIKTKLFKSMEKSGANKRFKMGQATENDMLDRAVYDALDDGIIESVSKVAPAMPGEATNIADLYKQYAQLKQMQNVTSKEVARSNTNNIFSLGSMIGAAGSLARGGIGEAAATLGGIEGMKRLGPQIGAKALDVAGKSLQKFQAPVQSLASPVRAAVGVSHLQDLLSNYEKTKNQYVSPQQAADMWQNQK